MTLFPVEMTDNNSNSSSSNNNSNSNNNNNSSNIYSNKLFQVAALVNRDKCYDETMHHYSIAIQMEGIIRVDNRNGNTRLLVDHGGSHIRVASQRCIRTTLLEALTGRLKQGPLFPLVAVPAAMVIVVMDRTEVV